VARSNEARLTQRVCKLTGARAAELGDRVQALWGGYGELRRVELEGAQRETVVVKHVTPPHERELGGDARALRSHRRKLRSYAVELAFYRNYAARCSDACRVPALIHGCADDGGFLFILEDLDAAGFPGRSRQACDAEIHAGLEWLAAFHAQFLHTVPEGLWKVGSYWHLGARPDELARLDSRALQRAAPLIDARLNQARFQTLVHGDAKLANFCFAKDPAHIAAVDFQYVGGGVGVKDVAYFLSSCLTSEQCAARVPGYLEVYFRALGARVANDQGAPVVDSSALENEWRALFPWAWVDFHRFFLGWAPAEASRDRYSNDLTHALLAALP